ncbi:ParB/Srx family N-terminal domain-containing protein [Paraburkholderia dioscoreae]|uniref:ParB/Sulfiredoxin domain-containing protein n=1 Tax=Paraburkholderia dioscoreae TaxID=2604047 RepID=A0A5Q4ZED6_9BURK|nr:ParB/Srx family N-terminal domain-containing protein [Paraburkholderia dioscoreae]VVD29132.1 conserved protein of unknown function [Paraburkholderia dioscoreae]
MVSKKVPAKKALPAKKAVTVDLDLESKSVEPIKLSLLDFDFENPRFGMTAGRTRTQTEILDYIVNDFGIEDVLSSISVNGFFVAEPLIARAQGNGRWTVVEGNRRLAACLVLAGDKRAKNQERKIAQYQGLQTKSKRKPFEAVPAIKFEQHEQERDLLSYLGVRHIAASQGWDSFAKAAWIARVVERNDLTLQEIALMTGDQHRTIKRLLEGYYFITQLIKDGVFDPESSSRKGRGSNIDFPFSWVYTALGYPTVREYVGMPEEPTPKPVAANKRTEASTLLVSMFGDSSKGRPAAIDDSREIGELASALGDEDKADLLRQGHRLEEVLYMTLPPATRLNDGLSECRDILQTIASMLAETMVADEVAEKYAPLAKRVRNLAGSIHRKLVSADDDEEI